MIEFPPTQFKDRTDTIDNAGSEANWKNVDMCCLVNKNDLLTQTLKGYYIYIYVSYTYIYMYDTYIYICIIHMYMYILIVRWYIY